MVNPVILMHVYRIIILQNLLGYDNMLHIVVKIDHTNIHTRAAKITVGM